MCIILYTKCIICILNYRITSFTALVWLHAKEMRLQIISGMRVHLSDHKTSRIPVCSDPVAPIINSIQPKMRKEMSDKSDRVRGEWCQGCERVLCFISGGIIQLTFALYTLGLLSASSNSHRLETTVHLNQSKTTLDPRRSNLIQAVRGRMCVRLCGATHFCHRAGVFPVSDAKQIRLNDV